MQQLVKLTDAANSRMVLLTVSELEASQPAIDVVFDLVGAEDLPKLITAGILPAGQLEDLQVLQQIIFDKDDQGAFIRDGITFTANGADLDPDQPLTQYFVKGDRDGIPYNLCSLIVSSPSMVAQLRPAQPPQMAPAATLNPSGQKAENQTKAQPEEADPTAEFALIMFLHQLNIGYEIDVTKDFPEISAEIAESEKNNWIEIDVKKAAFKLTEPGQAALKRYLDEAQNLIKRYDVYADVDVDGSGNVLFDTNLGKDLRVAAWEFEGVDPFRARFLLGINDGEWNNLSNWMELIHDRAWYDGIFDAIESAPAVDDIGESRMQVIIDQGKAALRKEQDASRNYS
jgi:hypothetical protein